MLCHISFNICLTDDLRTAPPTPESLTFIQTIYSKVYQLHACFNIFTLYCPCSTEGTAMDALTISRTQLFPEKEFDRKVEIRAENHALLRGRNNVTLCRSPTRDFDSGLIKNELKEKRHLEFLRRRSVSPEPRSTKCAICSSKAKPRQGTFTTRRRTPNKKTEMLHSNVEMSCFSPTIQTQRNNKADDPSTNRWVNYYYCFILINFSRPSFCSISPTLFSQFLRLYYGQNQ